MTRLCSSLLAAALLVLAACGADTGGAANSHTHDSVADVTQIDGDSPYKGAWLDTPYDLPAAQFLDTEGNQVVWPDDGLPAPVTIVFFGYTNCADGFCQTQTANAAAALRGLTDAERSQVAVVVITSDPARDTGPVLRQFLDLYDPTFIGLTGDLSQIKSAGLALGVQIDDPPSPAPAEGYVVGHGTQLIGFGPDGTAPVLWLPETPIADIRADIRVLLGLQ